jgi:hypothetical protein
LIFFSTAYVGEEQKPNVTLITGSILATILAVIIVVVGLCWARKKADSGDTCGKNKSPSDCETLEYRNGEGTKQIFCPIDLCLYIVVKKFIFECSYDDLRCWTMADFFIVCVEKLMFDVYLFLLLLSGLAFLEQ